MKMAEEFKRQTERERGGGRDEKKLNYTHKAGYSEPKTGIGIRSA